jgi:hypothetical protein
MGPDCKKNDHDPANREDRKRRRKEDQGDQGNNLGSGHHSRQVVTTLCHTDVPNVKRQRLDEGDNLLIDPSHEGFLAARTDPDELVLWYWFNSPDVSQRIREEEAESKSAIAQWSSTVPVAE